MLRQTKVFSSYPNKSILEDLITRTGPATDDCFTPFEGKQKVIESQFVGNWKVRYKQADFLKYSLNTYKDLNPSRMRKISSDSMLQEVDAPTGMYTTLEDLFVNGIENPNVNAYVVQMCVGYKKNGKSPAKETRETYTYTLQNNDDQMEEEKFLQIRDDENLSNEDFEEVVKELPYVMKSIWSYSKQYKANLFSFIFAYIDIMSRDRKRKYVNITDFQDYHTFLLKSDGTFVREFVHANDNKYVIYPNVTKIFIYPDEHVAEFGLCKKFIDILRILGIDYRDENPYEYTNEFINSIVCTYLPSNEEYFNEYKDVDIEIMIALKPENIFNVAKSNMYMNTFKESYEFDYNQSAYFVTERIKLAYRMGEISDNVLSDRSEEVFKIVKLVLTIEAKKSVEVPTQFLTFESNGLLHFKKDLLLLDGKYFGKFNGRYDYKVALTKYGFMTILEEDYGDDVSVIMLDDCIEALKEYMAYGRVQGEVCRKYLGNIGR